MNILLWHVHGSWTTAFVQGTHQYFVPVVPGRGPDGRGRAQTWDWPASVAEVTLDQAAALDIDLVVLQRPEELEHHATCWLGGRRPGIDVPAVYLEHNTPQGRIADMRHPAGDRNDIPIVHVTHFNDLFWDAGRAPTVVIEHGVPDPGYRYTGDLARGAAVINEPVRRGRVTGTDLLERFQAQVDVDVFGMGARALEGIEDLGQDVLHDELARRRAYLHPIRWTSLGLSLLEAMYLGMPVVALATTEVVEAVPEAVGVTSTNVEVLVKAFRDFVCDRERARETGLRAREFVCGRYPLGAFLARWDQLIEEVTR